MALRALLRKVASVASLDLQQDNDEGKAEIAFVEAMLQGGLHHASTNNIELLFHPECDIVVEQSSVVNDDGSSSPSCETEEKTVKTLMNEMTKLMESFPDFRHSFSAPRRSKPGIIVVDSCQGIGTHTGSPYSCGRPYPPIDAKNVKVRCDPEKLIFHVSPNPSDGALQVVKMEVIPMGRFSGPTGFYQMIGGILF